ncbi:rod-binding protein [Sulfitobacter sp. D35]|uniref:rod-binding protein n=1 Tax=Sulfitobacter sp. D35 TaxID=3083252 RepID=UPI00296FA97E|nr:rod-binding protein [Sulfitobacter sp. D35]MDW4498257.1 rod-binding protein [Sulfitobacter sp. D35]
MITPPSPAAPGAAAKHEPALRAAAQELEASFLAEMLKAAGLGESRTAFGGGAGEDQFASLLVAEQAKAIVRTGGIGLAETLYEALKETRHDK